MRWDQPWALLGLLIVPWLLWRGRREVGRRAAVLWVRVAGAWSAGRAALPLKATAFLPWVALRIGLVAFAATSFTLCPLTLDHAVLTELLESLNFGMAEDGTAIGMGLATAV